MKKLVYLASASSGDRVKLHNLALQLTNSTRIVYSPCLGFFGQEDERTRKLIMNHCLRTVADSDVLVAYLEEFVPTQGVWEELRQVLESSKPACFLVEQRVFAVPTMFSSFPVWYTPFQVIKWLNELK